MTRARTGSERLSARAATCESAAVAGSSSEVEERVPVHRIGRGERGSRDELVLGSRLGLELEAFAQLYARTCGAFRASS